MLRILKLSEAFQHQKMIFQLIVCVKQDYEIVKCLVISDSNCYMPKQFLTINKEFLQEQNYEMAHQNSIALNNKYSEFCDMLKGTFQSLANNKIEIPEKNGEVGFMESKKQYLFLKELKIFIKAFTQISYQMSSYQISCFESLKDNNIPSLDITYQVLQRVRQNKQLSLTIEEQRVKLVHNHAQIKKNYSDFERRMKNAVSYYQPGTVNEDIKQIQQSVEESNKIMSQCESQREAMEEKINQFEPYLSTFRKKLVKNKYVVLKKLVFLINNTKNATIQIFDALRVCAMEKQADFIKVIEDKTDNVTYLTDYLNKKMVESNNFEHHIQQNKKWEKYASMTIRQLEDTFEQIEFIITQLISYYNQFVNICNEQHEMFRKLAIQINQFFIDQESPYPMMKELLDIQMHFNSKFNHIIIKLQQINNKVRNEKKYCKKQSEILLTMIKVNRINYKSTLQNLSRDKELIELIQKISFETTKKMLVSLYVQFINLENQILEKFDTQIHKKKAIYNSMQISHTIREPKSIEKKVPLKTEYWLWKEWTSEIQINFEYYHNYYDAIEKFIDSMTTVTNVKDSTQLEMYSCTLIESKNEYEGNIVVKVNSLDFSNSELKLVVPWKQIDNIYKENKMFKDFLVINTLKGDLRFKQILALSNVVESLKQAHEKGLMGNKKKLDRKPEVPLSEEEMAAIKKRRQQIQTKLPDLTQYKQLYEYTFERIRIDELYYIFYSDRPFSFYGRQEPNFIIYLGKKGGNYDYTYEKYDKPGPTFYTMEPDISFVEAPLYSSRNTTLTHPMKPSAIPFMPKTCQNQFQERLYWISDQEFMLINESITKGVPYSDCFRCFVAYILKKQGDGVHFTCKLWVKWIEDTMMKGQIYGSIEPEIKENAENQAKEIDKVLKLMESMENGEQVQIEQEGAVSGVQKPPENELSRLKKNNQYLIIGMIVIILANILFMIIY